MIKRMLKPITQITNPKHPYPNNDRNFNNQNSKLKTDQYSFWLLNIVNSNLFGIWDLVIGI
jgi:hypothetical protein